jgi:hypothetical protein
VFGLGLLPTGSEVRSKRAITVLFPEPLSPTTATFWPRLMLSERPFRIFTYGMFMK